MALWSRVDGALHPAGPLGIPGLAGRRRAAACTDPRLYAANAILNVGWTYLFFRAERPALAGVEILVLLATIVALVVLMRPVNRQASWALVPYGAWVAFATALTWTITATN